VGAVLGVTGRAAPCGRHACASGLCHTLVGPGEFNPALARGVG
jgi:hypothetical protein